MILEKMMVLCHNELRFELVNFKFMMMIRKKRNDLCHIK